jgi:hypothetical protein
MKYVAAREGFGGYIYFQDNENDSPKWTGEISEAMRFDTEEDAVTKSDRTGVYADSITSIKVEQ